ncbi:MAG: sensor domain-containing diguanylate cyclase [Planctomycetota bacterium]|nr:sensor domain-containing diguanylate cyclase [Planctomycetota bacterium]
MKSPGKHLHNQNSAACSSALEEGLEGAASYFRQIVEKSHNAVVIFDPEAKIHFWNAAATLMFGHEPESTLGIDLIELLIPARYQLQERQIIEEYQESGDFAAFSEMCEIERVRKDGSEIWVETFLSPLEVNGQRWGFTVIRNSDARKQREMELTRQATSDSLTGLANRREFQNKLEDHLGQPLCLAILDIDRFKGWNDMYGHPVGDQAIQIVSSAMEETFAEAICIGRLGGDEFGILLTLGQYPDLVTAEVAVHERFETLRRRISDAESLQQRITISIGIAIAASNSSPRQLLSAADKMLYQCKESGRDRTALCVS